jgi:hypothetical protein
MTVQIRGFSFAMSATIPIPTGTVAGDTLVCMVRSFYQDTADPSPWVAPADWTEWANGIRGTAIFGAPNTVAFGYGTFTKTAAAGEGTPTFSAPLSDQQIGAVWSLYSDVPLPVSLDHGEASDYADGQTFRLPVLHTANAGARLVYGFSGIANTLTAYGGFVNTRTHHDGATLTTTTGYPSVPAGAPEYPERLKVMTLSLDSEPGPWATTGQRTVDTDVSPAGIDAPAHFSSYVRVQEIGVAPAPGGWTGWIID